MLPWSNVKYVNAIDAYHTVWWTYLDHRKKIDEQQKIYFHISMFAYGMSRMLMASETIFICPSMKAAYILLYFKYAI